MAVTTATRRLAAILAADVAGYSRLMGADEEGTHERLRAHLRELVDPKIKEHHGRIVKHTGDGMLAEFASVVDAVRCAAEVQRTMADRNAKTAEDRRITFRIGVNLGDVIAEEDDIYGDGVTYKGKPVNAKQIGRELGVRYVLEGSVRRSGNQVRVSAQLIDAATDTHLWAERFDRDTGDLFALQNEITRQIAMALNSELVTAEASRPTEHPDVLDYILRGRAAANEGATRDGLARAVDLFEHALALDPQSIEAQSLLAFALTGRVLAGMTHTRAADLRRAADLIDQALAESPRSTPAHSVKAQLLRAKGRFDEAIPELEMVIASNRNSPGALFALGECKLLTGSIDEAITLEEQAIRLGPRDPYVFNRYLMIGRVHLLQSRTEEAIVWLERARIGNPGSPWPHVWLASAYALNGDLDPGGAELAEARRLLGGKAFTSIAAMRAGNWGVPAIRELHEATFFAGLRKAGVPEE